MENLIEGNSQAIKTKFCKYCGEKILFDAVICTKCGMQVEELKSNQPNIVINNENTNNIAATYKMKKAVNILSELQSLQNVYCQKKTT